MKLLIITILLKVFLLSAIFARKINKFEKFDKIDWKKVKVNTNIPSEYDKKIKLIANSTDLTTRVIGGKPARRHQFPYQVGMELDKGSHMEWCGGSLITPNYVLTAAHCAHRLDDGVLYFGTHDYTTDHEVEQVRMYISSDDAIIHKGYNPRNAANDIALIQLPNPVEVDEKTKDYIKPIRLEEDDVKGNRTCVASGWGKVDDGSEPEKLRYVNLKTLDNKQCKSYFEQFVQDTNICTDSSHGTKGICSGDSGGPLVIKDEETQEYKLIGLSSFGSKAGCMNGYPSVYTRVSQFVDWIRQHSDYK